MIVLKNTFTFYQAMLNRAPPSSLTFLQVCPQTPRIWRFIITQVAFVHLPSLCILEHDFKTSTWQDIKLHPLHLFHLCIFICILEQPEWKNAYSHRMHLLNFLRCILSSASSYGLRSDLLGSDIIPAHLLMIERKYLNEKVKVKAPHQPKCQYVQDHSRINNTPRWPHWRTPSKRKKKTKVTIFPKAGKGLVFKGKGAHKWITTSSPTRKRGSDPKRN